MKKTDEKKENILIVGGSGFIGFATIHALIAAGFNIRVLDPFLHKDLPAEVQAYQGTTENLSLVAQALSNCNRVIFLGGNSAPAAGIPTVECEIANELLPVIHFAEICATAGCQQFIFASSGGTVYGSSALEQIPETHQCSPISSYGVSKLSIELYLAVLSRNTKMDTLSLRLSNPYGPEQIVKRNQGFVAAAMSAVFNDDILSIWGDGSVTRDYIYIDDVAEAFVAACIHEPITDTINIGSGIGVSLLELCKAINNSTNKLLSLKFEPARTVDIPRNVLSTQYAKNTLKWTSKIKLEEGLQLTAEWWGK
jgi:UDP-glucose 4-epimerase